MYGIPVLLPLHWSYLGPGVSRGLGFRTCRLQISPGLLVLEGASIVGGAVCPRARSGEVVLGGVRGIWVFLLDVPDTLTLPCGSLLPQDNSAGLGTRIWGGLVIGRGDPSLRGIVLLRCVHFA